jgi:hypothetical protein
LASLVDLPGISLRINRRRFSSTMDSFILRQDFQAIAIDFRLAADAVTSEPEQPQVGAAARAARARCLQPRVARAIGGHRLRVANRDCAPSAARAVHPHVAGRRAAPGSVLRPAHRSRRLGMRCGENLGTPAALHARVIAVRSRSPVTPWKIRRSGTRSSRGTSASTSSVAV